MSRPEVVRGLLQRGFMRLEDAFDVPFGGAGNPLRHLGALGLYLMWIVVGTGLYLYIVVDIGIEAVYRSITYQSETLWYVGGIMRSLHRYASDAFVFVMMLHLLREWLFGRYRGFRFYSWLTGIPVLWLVYISGISGYWIVWDELAQYSATATTELIDWLPFMSDASARNFLVHTITDRFFALLVLIHIGVPVFLLLTMWMHVHRISHVDYLPNRSLMQGTAIALLLLSVLKPAMSNPPANLAHVPEALGMDWFILFINPLTDATSPAVVWSLLAAGTILLSLLPFLGRVKPWSAREAVAVVDPGHCNGCTRCQVDCPFSAIIMAPHPHRPGYPVAVVDADLCAACGICAGSCPSSTPFRSGEVLATGIDIPALTIDALRQELESALPGLQGGQRIVVFGCDQGLPVAAFADGGTAVLSLPCAGQLPPSFVEYALRTGADGVVVVPCRDGGCAYRLGERWLRERLQRAREPVLRTRVPQERILIAPASLFDRAAFSSALNGFRTRLATLKQDGASFQPYQRRTSHHA